MNVYVSVYECVYVCMYVCMCVCLCMSVCMHVCVCLSTNLTASGPVDALVGQASCARANSSERWTGRIVASLPGCHVSVGEVRAAQRVDGRGGRYLKG